MKLDMADALGDLRFSLIDRGQPFLRNGRVYLKLSNDFIGDYNALDLGNLKLYYFARDILVDKLYSRNSEFKIYPLHKSSEDF